MDAILLFNANFKTYANHVISETFLIFFFQVLSSSGFAAGLFIYFLSSFLFPVLLFPSLCLIYFSSLQIIRTRTFVRKKDLVLPRLRLKYSSALSLFLSFLSSLFRSYSQFYFLSLSDK